MKWFNPKLAVFSLLFAFVAVFAFAAGFERIQQDTLKLGSGSSSDKTIEFDTGVSPNTEIVVDSTGDDGTFTVNNLVLGDGAASEKNLEFDTGDGASNVNLAVSATRDFTLSGLQAGYLKTDNVVIGDTNAADQVLTFDANNGANNAQILWDEGNSRLEFTNDGITYSAIGSGGGGVEYTLAKQAVGSVGSANQILAAHELTEDSFPFASTGKAYFYNGDDATDASLNGRDLSNDFGMVFSNSDQWGTASNAAEFNGTNKYLYSTHADLDPGDVDAALFGWFELDDWTPASEEVMIAIGSGAADWAMEIYADTDGIHFVATDDGTNVDVDIVFDSTGLANDSWHHVAIVFDTTDDIVHAYVDGVWFGSSGLASLWGLSTDRFTVGARYSAQDYLNGSARDFGLVKTELLNGTDVRKLYSSRLDTGVPVTTNLQQWKSYYERADNEITYLMPTGWVVDQRTQSVYIDLALDPTDQVTIKLYNFQ